MIRYVHPNTFPAVLRLISLLHTPLNFITALQDIDYTQRRPLVQGSIKDSFTMISFKDLPIAVVSLLFALFALIGDVQSLPAACVNSTKPRSPCAQVSYLVSEKNLTTIPAQLAHECLVSVPLHVAEAQNLHRSLDAYMKWQSTLSYLQDPPSGYQMSAFDFWAAFNHIGENLSNAAYSSEWDFGMDLLRATTNVHDDHLRYILDVVGKVFKFGRGVDLVSVSQDGLSLPMVYVHGKVLNSPSFKSLTRDADDVYQWFNNNVSSSAANISFPAPIATINGQDVRHFLDSWMRIGTHQDLDALYNSLFWSATQNTMTASRLPSGLFSSSGFAKVYYPGPATEIILVNGTRRIYQNFAKINPALNFTGLVDGETFYDRFCTGQDEAAASIASNTTETLSEVTTATPGYPLPVIRHPQNMIAGYYINDSLYDKVAILSISDFVLGDVNAVQTNFARTYRDFIRLATAAGKTKLIIDLRGNIGGTIMQAFGLFLELFPDIEPWGATRFRAFDTLDTIGEQVSSLANAFYSGSNTTEMYRGAAGIEPYDYHLVVDSEGEDFCNWAELYSPIHIPGRDNFTHLIRYNLSSPGLTTDLGINFPAPSSSRPFNSEDIIMLHDGVCMSTCATFSDLLREQAGIKTVVLGGRPQYEPMQAVGGSRGTEMYTFGGIYSFMEYIWNSGTAEQQSEWNVTAPDLANLSEEPVRRLAMESGGSINVRDSILEKSVGDGMPSQFLWAPADCRLFYTAEMVEDVSAVWRLVGDVAWGGMGVGAGEERTSCIVGEL
jgi:Peptidase family S41